MKSIKGLMAMPLVAAGLAIAAPGAVSAHHSFSMFDRDTQLVIRGTVARWAFNNPHVFIFIQQEETGTVYAMEGAAPPSLIARNPGMDGNTFQVGQPVTTIMCALHDGRPGGAIGLVFTEDGTIYNPSDGGCNANARRDDWERWLEAGFMSLDEALAAEPEEEEEEEEVEDEDEDEDEDDEEAVPAPE